MAPIDSSTYSTLTVSSPAPKVSLHDEDGGSGGPGGGSGGPGGGGNGGPGGGGSTSMTVVDPNPTTQDELNELICNIMRSSDNSIPTDVEYTNNGGNLATSWGISTSGVAYFNGISGEDVDPFYPAAYGKCTDGDCVEMSDSCFGHPGFGGDYHYHSASPCSADTSRGASGAVTEDQSYDWFSIIKSTWLAAYPYRAVAGVSKDGRPIYSPHYNNG